MKITDRQANAYEAAVQHQKKVEGNQHKATDKEKDKKNVVADKLTKSEPVQKATYDRPAAVRDDKVVDRLLSESNRAHEHLRELVIRLLERQGMSAERLKQEGPEVKIDDEARSELEALLGPEGELGIEKTSDRIVDFAIALSGGDKEKAGLLRDAIAKGFEEAEKALGELPEISKQTYDRVMEKFDAWAKGEE